MIEQFKELLEDFKVKNILIPSDKVAHVFMENNLEHALLVLTKSGYSMVPVLDLNYRLQGLISTTMIMDAIFGLERIEIDRLSDIKVEEVMNREIPRLQIEDEFQRGLEVVIDSPFVCVENENEVFVGILTRREILKKLNKDIRTNVYQKD